MRTSLFALALLLLPAASAQATPPVELTLGPEVTLVGLAAGARAEVFWRPGGEGSASRLRLAPGFLLGPEFAYVPVAAGYRALYRSQQTVMPLVGGGLEYQRRWVTDAPAAQNLSAYVEAGGQMRVASNVTVGAAATLDFAFLGPPGAGLALRGFAGWGF